MKCFIAFLILLSARAFGAAGDISTVTIGAEGWYADILILGKATGGTYDFGLGAFNGVSGSPKVVLTVTSLGYDNAGSATTLARTVYGTHEVRKPFNNAGVNQETTSGSDVIVRVALSDFVFLKDNAGGGNSGTAVTYSIAAGFYTATGGNNSGSGTVVNNSTLAYPRVIANDAWVDFDQITSTTWPARVVAFGWGAQSGRPVRAVKFTASDAHAHTTSAVFVTAPTIDWTMGDATPAPEYIATLDASTLTQGDAVSVNYVVYPWLGDSGSVLDSNDGTNSLPTPLYTNQKWLNNKTGGYGGAKVAVSTTGNDGTGAASNSEAGAFVNPFLTIAAAYNAGQIYNNANYSHNDGGGVTIYCDTGSYAFPGGTVTDTSTVPATWTILTRRSSAARSGVKLTSVSGSSRLNPKTRFYDITINLNSGNLFPNQYLWIDQCVLDSSNTGGLFSSYQLGYYTRNVTTQWRPGWSAFGTENDPTALIRGNDMTGTGANATANTIYTVIGNKTSTGTSANTFTWTTKVGGTAAPAANGAIFAFNDFKGIFITSGTYLSAYNADANATGFACVQNILEHRSSDATSVLIALSADASTSDPVRNILLWNNTIAGNRINRGYNDANSTAPLRTLWQDAGNIWQVKATKHDTFTGSGGGNGVRTNAWPVLYGVGNYGTSDPEDTAISAAGSFMDEFPGINCDTPTLTGGTQPKQAVARAANYVKWVDPKAAINGIGTGDGVGGGNYRLQASSPVINVPTRLVLPFDITGRDRAAHSPPGAHYFAHPGGGFF